MTYSSPELLPALLEKVSATLQELYLEQSGIIDSHLGSHLACSEPLLPAHILQSAWEPPLHAHHEEDAATYL